MSTTRLLHQEDINRYISSRDENENVDEDYFQTVDTVMEDIDESDDIHEGYSETEDYELEMY